MKPIVFKCTHINTFYQLLRNSRSLRKTTRGSGCSDRPGKASRNPAITEGLCKRKNVLISFANPIDIRGIEAEIKNTLGLVELPRKDVID